MMRHFFGLSGQELVRNSTIQNTTVDGTSCISSSLLGSASSGAASGFVRNSVVSNVRCKYIEAENCVLINVTAERIVAKPGSIIYNLIDADSAIEVGAQEVRVGVFDDSCTQQVIRSDMETDGGKAWEIRVAGNTQSFEEVYNSNANADPTHLEQIIATAHDAAWQKISS